MPLGCYIKYNILRVKPERLSSVISFYTTICGMNYEQYPVLPSDRITQQDNIRHCFSFHHKDVLYKPTSLCFIVDSDFTTDCSDAGYWKIGIAVQDVDAAVCFLQGHGVDVEPASQFCDIGYLTSLRDPQGYSIELLQTTFQDNFTAVQANRSAPLNQVEMPTLGQITIRCVHLQRTNTFYTEKLGLKLLCTEVPNNKKYPFSLHFFAFTAEAPRCSDPAAIPNREWVYGRPYCQIEVQHRHISPEHYITSSIGGRNVGHVGISISVTKEVWERVLKEFLQEGQESVVYSGKNILRVRDPDGYLIEIIHEPS